MQSMINIRTTYGLPLCLSTITRFHHLSLSTQIADHDRRRKEMKRAITTEHRNIIPADEIDGEVREIQAVIRSSDLVMFNLDNREDHDHDHDSDHDRRNSTCAAKAA